MAKQVNLVHLEDAMIRAKQYVDDQATANVIRTATTLWSGYQIYPTTDNTPFSTQMVATNTAYITMYGQTTGGITLSDRLDNYDEIEVGINRVINNNGVSTNYGNTTYTFPVSDIIDTANNRYRLRLFEWYGDVFNTNDKAYAYFGCQDHNKLGVHIVLSGANDNWHITYVKGIKYTVPETYSTNEQIIGTWIDGKPLYQKTVTGTSPSASGDMPLGLTNVDKIFIDSGYLEAGAYNYIMSMPGYYSGANDFCSVDIMPDKTGVYFQMSNARWANRPFVITFKYTKTTDQGGA